MRSVFSYASYRKYLADYYRERKRAVSGFSYRAFGEKAGLSPNYMKLVIDGRRDLTPATIQAFARALELDFDEHQCFEALVLCEQAATEAERSYHQEKLRRLKARKPRVIERLTIGTLIRQWYYPAVWLALSGRPEGVGVDEVAATAGISRDLAAEAVAVLVQARAVRLEDGCYRLRADCVIHADKDLYRRAQKSYLEAQLRRSQLAFDKAYAKGAKFYSHTFSTARGDLARYDEKIRELLLDVNASSDQEPVEDVVQLNVQMFRVGSPA